MDNVEGLVDSAMEDPEFLESFAKSREDLADQFETDLNRNRATISKTPLMSLPLDAPIHLDAIHQIAELRRHATSLRKRAAEIRKSQSEGEG